MLMLRPGRVAFLMTVRSWSGSALIEVRSIRGAVCHAKGTSGSRLPATRSERGMNSFPAYESFLWRTCVKHFYGSYRRIHPPSWAWSMTPQDSGTGLSD